MKKKGKSRKAACQGPGVKAWQCSRAARAARKGRASVPSGGSQGLGDGDLLVELCSKLRQPGS